jgi:protein-S-isoprenylcysteine O-methyltransferase Ste14
VIYDINSVIYNNKIIKSFFLLGTLLIIFATVSIIIESIDTIEWDFWRMTIGGILTILFFALLIYTLFFAIPFDTTYIKETCIQRVCQNGVYALCRHPGVLWFWGFYFFLWVTLTSPLLLIAALVFSICNFMYVIFQDFWTFPHIFEDYQNYKKFTPFIIPNYKSIKRCLQTLS